MTMIRGPDLSRASREPVEIDVHRPRIKRDLMDRQTVEPRGPARMVRGVAARGFRDHHHRIPRAGESHEGIEVGEGSAQHAGLHERGVEEGARKFGRDDLDSFRIGEPRLVLVPRIPQARPASQRPTKQGARPGAHDVGGGVEVDAQIVRPALLARRQALHVVDGCGGTEAGDLVREPRVPCVDARRDPRPFLRANHSALLPFTPSRMNPILFAAVNRRRARSRDPARRPAFRPSLPGRCNTHGVVR